MLDSEFLDSEFWAVLKALIDYYLALIARSKITDFRDHITADGSVQDAQKNLITAFKNLQSAERHKYNTERRVILGIPPEEPGDDIPF